MKIESIWEKQTNMLSQFWENKQNSVTSITISLKVVFVCK